MLLNGALAGDEEAQMRYPLKAISPTGIPHAIAKAERYRFLNEPEEAESICRDILAVEPANQLALRLLGLCITDQFTGQTSDRYSEADEAFQKLADAYERLYYAGVLQERRAKAQLKAGHSARALAARFEEAMRLFNEAANIRPAGNDDALLRWNRCARLLETLPEEERAREIEFEAGDSPPVGSGLRRAGSR
jgi:tetratricopeptide (TPR) repeat protein